MIVLACIPLAALLVAAALALSVRRQFQQGVSKIAVESEARQREALTADAAHDRQLPAELIQGRYPPAKCLALYRAGRPAIARAAGVDLAEDWTPEELNLSLARRRRDRAVELRRRVLHRAAVGSLVIVVVAGGAAAYRYHMISQGRSPVAVDPGAAMNFPGDPFAAQAATVSAP